MRVLTCCKCGELKKDIEFQYLYFRKRYSKKCKDCEIKEEKKR